MPMRISFEASLTLITFLTVFLVFFDLALGRLTTLRETAFFLLVLEGFFRILLADRPGGFLLS